MRIAIHADGVLSRTGPKLVYAALRYRPDEVVAVIDSHHSGATTVDVTGDPSLADVPIVTDVDAALAFEPDTFLVGVSLLRTSMPPELRADVLAALTAGLDVISGLHYPLSSDPGVVKTSAMHHTKIWDLRQPKEPFFEVVPDLHRTGSGWVTLAVGSDGSVGKMTTMIEIDLAARSAGASSTVVATGQTGLFLVGRGFPSDHIVSDFVPTTARLEASAAAALTELVFVEGQGALNHPMYSNGALGLLHGVDPDALILCHRAGAAHLAGRPGSLLPPLSDLVQMNEQAATWGSDRRPRVVGIALDTSRLDLSAARHEVARAAGETGLPATDPVRFGASSLLDAVLVSRSSKR